MRWWPFFLAVSLHAVLPITSSLVCAEQPLPQPPCVGYNREAKEWGWDSPTEVTSRLCPPQYAFYSLDRSGGPNREGARVPAMGDCCPLPSLDVLTGEHIISEMDCPADFVATGGYFDNLFDRSAPSRFRCTKINTIRYQLGDQTPGVMWGTASQAAFPWIEPKRILRRTIPISIRYGIGREGRRRWSHSGCIGDPIGSLVTAKRGAWCKSIIFRQLQYRGMVGDPPSGTAVRMYPDCRNVSDIFDPDAQCLP